MKITITLFSSFVVSMPGIRVTLKVQKVNMSGLIYLGVVVYLHLKNISIYSFAGRDRKEKK